MSLELGKTLQEQLSEEVGIKSTYKKPRFDSNTKLLTELSENVDEGSMENTLTKGKQAGQLGTDA